MAIRPAGGGGSNVPKPPPGGAGKKRPTSNRPAPRAPEEQGGAPGGPPSVSGAVKGAAGKATSTGRKAAKGAIATYTGGTGAAAMSILPTPLDSKEERKKKWKRLALVGIALVAVLAVVVSSVFFLGLTLMTAILGGGNTRPESPGTCLNIELEEAGEGADAPRPTRGGGTFGYPVDPEIPITSGFGPRGGTNHNGTDFGVPQGGNMYAMLDGEVVQAGPATGFDHWVVTRHEFEGETIDVVYGHLDADTMDVKAGDKVKSGDVLGQVGAVDPGEDSTGPHLHLEIHPGGWAQGNAVDAMPYLDRMKAAAPEGGGEGSEQAGAVTVIGDSLTEGAKGQIAEKLPDANIDSKVGRQFSEGLDILKQMPEEEKGDKILFPLGTNGPFGDADVNSLLEAAGERPVVLMTVGGPNVSAASSVNPVVKKAADAHADRVSIADWAAKVEEDPGLVGGDGIHPSPEGQKVFADLIAEAAGGSGGAPAAGAPSAGAPEEEPADDEDGDPREQVSAESSGDTAPQPEGTVTAADWEKLAECESGGKWDIDTGNGFSGGLQFTAETWKGFGGDEFAENAHEATKEQQMEVANRILAEQGWGAWPACTNGTYPELKALKPAPEGTFVGGGGGDTDEAGNDAGASGSEEDGAAPNLQSQLDDIVDEAKGAGVTLGVATSPVEGGNAVSAGEAGSEVYAASTIKVAIAATVEKKLKQDDTVKVSADNVVGGTGTGLEAGEYPVSELEEKMITASDNTATNALIDAVGGFDAVNSVVSDAGVSGGYSLGNKMMADPGPTRSMISAEGANEFLSALWKASESDGEFIAKDQAAHVIDLMKQQTLRGKLPAEIPEGKSANKTGENDGVSHDIGFIWPESGSPMSVAVTTEFTGDRANADQFVSRVGKAIFDSGAGGESGGGSGDELDETPSTVGSEEGLQTDAVRGMRLAANRFPEVNKIEGHRKDDASPDVAAGRAIDVMVPEGDKGVQLGDRVAELFTDNSDELHVEYVQWNGRIWDGGSWEDAPNKSEAPDSRVRVTFRGGGAPNKDTKYMGVGESGADTSAASPNSPEGNQLAQNLTAEQQANIKAIIVAAKDERIEPAERAAVLGVMLSGYSANFTNLSDDDDPNKVGIFGESPFGGKTASQLMNVEKTSTRFMDDLDKVIDERDTWATDKASDVLVAMYPERASLQQELDRWEEMSTEIVEKLWDDENAQAGSALELVGDDAEACAVGAPTSSAGLNEGEVPPEFVPWLKRAGELCEGIDAPLLAAQIEAESGFQQHGHNDAGAAGITQFIDSTWNNQYGKKVDDEGNAIGPPGSGDRNDIGDAIMAQGNYMCDIRAQIDGWIKNGEVKGDITELSLAGYNAGEPAVHSAGGMPSGGEYTTQTQPYVKKIMAARDKYAAVGESGGTSSKSSKSKSGKSGDGSIGAKALESAREEEGKPYGWGATGPDSWDCSSLVQKAYRDQGIELPRVTYDQIKEGEEIPIEDAKPGDLIFSNFSAPGVPEHVSMYVSPTRHYEAQTTGVPVGEHDMWADDMIVKRVY